MLSLEIAWTPVIAVVTVGAVCVALLKAAEWLAAKRADTHTRALLAGDARAECDAQSPR